MYYFSKRNKGLRNLKVILKDSFIQVYDFFSPEVPNQRQKIRHCTQWRNVSLETPKDERILGLWEVPLSAMWKSDIKDVNAIVGYFSFF